MTSEQLKGNDKHSMGAWLQLHLPVLLYAWFWFGMFLCGLLAPPDRVTELDSVLVREGWHLSVMCCVLGLPVVALYVRRMRRSRSRVEAELGS